MSKLEVKRNIVAANKLSIGVAFLFDHACTVLHLAAFICDCTAGSGGLFHTNNISSYFTLFGNIQLPADAVVVISS